MFSGMPAYQIAMDPQSVSIPELFIGPLTLFLKKPASFFFLAAICFYFLASVLRINPWISIIGGLTYAYATYNPVIVSVGHDTKMQAIAMMPAVIGSLILTCERRYWLGMTLTALFTALMVQTNHMQIVYYTMIICGGLLISYAITWLRNKEGIQLARTVTITAGAAIIGVLSNAVVLFTTYDSSKETIRGGSELADAHSSYTADGLAEQSAFDFSMYKLEPFMMLVPDIYGGSTDVPAISPEKSKAVDAMGKMPEELQKQIGEDGPRYYWGGVGELMSGPPYVGAIVILLALIGIFILDNRHKWWMLGVALLTIVMSWGGYFQAFNGILLKWLPGYNKFRAPSMILVVPTLLFCMMGSMALQKIVSTEDKKTLWPSYRNALLTITGIFVLLTVLYFRFDYSSSYEEGLLKKAAEKGTAAMASMQNFAQALREDRQQIFAQSLVRSAVLIAVATLIIGLFIRRQSLRPAYLIVPIGLLAFADIMNIDLRYLNFSNYQEKNDYQQNFTLTNADKQIMTDNGIYRVFDLRDSISNALSYGAMTAYFHNSIGGYHAAKLKIYEDLINHQLFNYPHCAGVINMLNTRYIIKHTRAGEDTVLTNGKALGPVWFVKNVQFRPTPAGVMNSLTNFHPSDTAVVFSADSAAVAYDAKPKDKEGYIELVRYDNDDVSYISETNDNRFAVFSEVFYKRGWRAWIDNKETPIIRTNYVLRGLSIPAGRHIIRFFFRPLSFYMGRQLQWMASIIFLLMMIGTVIVEIREKPNSVLLQGRPFWLRRRNIAYLRAKK